MRILLLTQWFHPEPFFKGLPLAKALRERGHEVEALTGFPNYPGGKLYPGYGIRPWSRERIDGIATTRLALYPSHNGRAIPRSLNYLSFGGSAALLGPWLVKRPDVVYVYNLITLGMAAGLIRRLTGAKIVHDVQDLWPESVTGSGMLASSLLHKVLGMWCRSEYRRPDRLVVLSPGFKRHLTDYGIAEDRIDVIYNWCDEQALVVPQASEDSLQTPGFKGRFNVVFAGTMGTVQAMDVVIECARILQQQAPDVLFTMVGGGVDVDRLRKNSEGMNNVQFLPKRPMAEMGKLLGGADALLVHLKRDPLFRITIPSKIQAYMFAGKPLLCGLEGDAVDLVQSADAGIPFEPESASSLADAVLRLRSLDAAERNRMGERGRRFYLEHLAFEKGVHKLEQAFRDAIAQGRNRQGAANKFERLASHG